MSALLTVSLIPEFHEADRRSLGDLRGLTGSIANGFRVEVCGSPGPQKRGCQVPGHGLHFVSRHPLQFSDVGMKINSAGEAEAGTAGEQPTEE